nr:protein DOG1-like 3 [Quercus suber]POF17271.1 protein dog1-like 3 [Quercus suber]
MPISESMAIRNGTSEPDSFHNFFEIWVSEQSQYLQELISASQHHKQSSNIGSEDDTVILSPLIGRVINHYEQYYGAKSKWAKQDVFAMLSPSWRSSLEDAFMWIGGWRPSMAFHLLYSKSGLQLEKKFTVLVRGFSSGDLGDLSPSQLNQVDALQRRTIVEEKETTEKMAELQETVADSSMVELSHVVSELMRERGGSVNGVEEERVESTLGPKEEGLEEILQKADDLRLRTLKAILEVLTPIQAVHFLIAAAELHLRLHDWGKRRDDVVRQHRGTGRTEQ